jgi:anion-transporting  ArsA/GET3 family ATPase
MFAGNCGVGKTTLSAALIRAGFIHYTDDTFAAYSAPVMATLLLFDRKKAHAGSGEL